MAFKTLPTRREPLTLATLAASIARRRAETGVTDVPRNTGTRRTASKAALLDEIEKLGKRW